MLIPGKWIGEGECKNGNAEDRSGWDVLHGEIGVLLDIELLQNSKHTNMKKA